MYIQRENRFIALNEY